MRPTTNSKHAAENRGKLTDCSRRAPADSVSGASKGCSSFGSISKPKTPTWPTSSCCSAFHILREMSVMCCMHTRHTSHITCHTSHITHHTSQITHHPSHVTNHTSHVTRHKSHITRHISHITHHASHITHHASHQTLLTLPTNSAPAAPRPASSCLRCCPHTPRSGTRAFAAQP